MYGFSLTLKEFRELSPKVAGTSGQLRLYVIATEKISEVLYFTSQLQPSLSILTLTIVEVY